MIGFSEVCHSFLVFVRKRDNFYIEFRRAAGSLEAVRELQISGKLVGIHDRHILEAQLLAPKTRKVRDHTVHRPLRDVRTAGLCNFL